MFFFSSFKIKSGGGLSFNSTCNLTHLNEKLIRSILHEYRIFLNFFLKKNLFVLTFKMNF